MLQQLLYSTAEPCLSRLLNAAHLQEQDNAFGIENLWQKTAAAELEVALTPSLAELQDREGKKVRERCFVPTEWAYWLTKPSAFTICSKELCRYRQRTDFCRCR